MIAAKDNGDDLPILIIEGLQDAELTVDIVEAFIEEIKVINTACLQQKWLTCASWTNVSYKFFHSLGLLHKVGKQVEEIKAADKAWVLITDQFAVQSLSLLPIHAPLQALPPSPPPSCPIFCLIWHLTYGDPLRGGGASTAHFSVFLLIASLPIVLY
jgi:hypothetical protein